MGRPKNIKRADNLLGVIYDVVRKTTGEVVYTGSSTGKVKDAINLLFAVNNVLFLIAPGNYDVIVRKTGDMPGDKLLTAETDAVIRQHVIDGQPILTRYISKDILYNPRTDYHGVQRKPGYDGHVVFQKAQPVGQNVEFVVSDPHVQWSVYAIERKNLVLFVSITDQQLTDEWFAKLVSYRPMIDDDVQGYTVRQLARCKTKAAAGRYAHAYGMLLHPVIDSRWTNTGAKYSMTTQEQCEACCNQFTTVVHGHKLCADCAAVYGEFALRAPAPVSSRKADVVREYTLYVIRDAFTGDAIYCGMTSSFKSRVWAHTERDILAGEDADAYQIVPVHVMRCTRKQCVEAERALTEALAIAGEPLRNLRFGDDHTQTSVNRLVQTRKTGIPMYQLMTHVLAHKQVDKDKMRRKVVATHMRRSPVVYREIETGELFASTKFIAIKYGGNPDKYYSMARRHDTPFEVVEKSQLTMDELMSVEKQIASYTGMPLNIAEHANTRKIKARKCKGGDNNE